MQSVARSRYGKPKIFITPFACCHSTSGMRCAQCMHLCDVPMISPMMRLCRCQSDARRSGVSDDPVFLALNDTQKRFEIPDALLEDLVRGTTMDLEENQPGVVAVTVATASELGSQARTFQIYESFDGLYRYCYLVASVVGLVCIRIF